MSASVLDDVTREVLREDGITHLRSRWLRPEEHTRSGGDMLLVSGRNPEFMVTPEILDLLGEAIGRPETLARDERGTTFNAYIWHPEG